MSVVGTFRREQRKKKRDWRRKDGADCERGDAVHTNEENLLASLNKTFDYTCGQLLFTAPRGTADFKNMAGFEAAIKELVEGWA